MNTKLEEIARSLPAWLVSAVLLSVLLSAACGSEPQAAEQEPMPDEEKAPSFELPAARGDITSLAQLLEGRDALVMVFYRGFF